MSLLAWSSGPWGTRGLFSPWTPFVSMTAGLIGPLDRSLCGSWRSPGVARQRASTNKADLSFMPEKVGALAENLNVVGRRDAGKLPKEIAEAGDDFPKTLPVFCDRFQAILCPSYTLPKHHLLYLKGAKTVVIFDHLPNMTTILRQAGPPPPTFEFEYSSTNQYVGSNKVAVWHEVWIIIMQRLIFLNGRQGGEISQFGNIL